MQFFTEEKYRELGLKCGVEIHQQLFTEQKQFCHCPAGLYSEAYDAEMLRHMRPTLSELGEYDGTALMEFKTKKEIIYRLHKQSVCTYEMDDTPPFLVNHQGLDIAIEIALLLNCNIVDEMHIARKQYLDGSIPTGFQRTAIVGVEGWVPYRDRKIGIIQLGYEEDSCRQVSNVGHTIVFRTDRLGMPLIEMVTYPDMHTPQDAAEVVRMLGRIARVTGKVRRGIGSVRQDVNVSIAGGTRIEIKGVPKIGYIPALVHVEALRQKALLELKIELGRRGIREDNLEILGKDVSELMSDSHLMQFQNALAKGHHIRGIKLCGLGGVLNYPTQPDINFDRELAGRVRVIACLDEQPIVFHTDNYRLYEGYRNDLKKLRKAFQCGDNDVIVLVWGPEPDTLTAADEIRLRVIDAIRGVPGETRQHFADGTTDFERILPGPDRMYPDTDLPPTRLDEERVRHIRTRLPEYPWRRESHYRERGVPQKIAQELAISAYAPLFEKLVELGVDATFAAVTLVQTLKALRRSGRPVASLTEHRVLEIFQGLAAGRFYREAVPNLLRLAADRPQSSIEDILREENMRVYAREELDRAIESALAQPPQFIPPYGAVARLTRYYMGRAMQTLRGRADAREVIDAITARIEQRQ